MAINLAFPQYTTWRREFILTRLRIGGIIGVIAVISFILLNLSRYPNLEPTWLYTNLTEEAALLFCLLLLFSPLGRSYPGLIFLLFSWALTLIPQYWYFLLEGVAKLDFVTWTLLFLGQTTLIPVRWSLHLLSQLGVFVCFFFIHGYLGAVVESNIAEADPLFLYLYLFWFCVICDISVFFYEKLQRQEFETRQNLEIEQEKSERLLLNILPQPIAERLKQPGATVAESFTEVTVLFADIADFTVMSTGMSPLQLVELLNEIFCKFDKLVEQHGLEKIKTIGDAYMVVAGLPEPCPNHVTQMAEMALDMQKTIAKFNQHNQKNLRIRIGIHTGPVVAGVIGIKKFAYDLWGDTVNIASRMESHGMPDKIQVSDDIYQVLKEYYVLIKRETIQVKGKGEMTTYWLLDRLT
jgi:adenylate cyclase